MRCIFVVVLFTFCQVNAYASDRYVKLSSDGTGFTYPLPDSWCDITQTTDGLRLLAYLQAVNNEAETGINVRLIIRPCKTLASSYPWAYVGLSSVDKFIGSSQFVYNQFIKSNLWLGMGDDLLDDIESAKSELSKEYFNLELKSDLSSLNKSVILESDINSITFSTLLTTKLGDSKVKEFVISSATLAKNHSIATYFYNDTTSKTANAEHIQLILANTKKIASLNRLME